MGQVSITVEVTNFVLLKQSGQANALGQGHIIYFLDVDAPTAPYRPALTATGTYASSADTSYTWTSIGSGRHKFSVELVNNDNTPLIPPVVDELIVDVP